MYLVRVGRTEAGGTGHKELTMETATPETTPVAAAATPKAKAAPKKVPAEKKAAKAPAKKVKAEKTGPSAGDRRKELVRYLRKVKAFGVSTSRSISEVAEKSGLDAYTLISGGTGKAGSNPRCLIATGHAKVTDVEDRPGKSVYLTKKGQDTDFSEDSFQ